MHTAICYSDETYHSRPYHLDRCNLQRSPNLCTLCSHQCQRCYTSVGMATRMDCNPCLVHTFLLFANKKVFLNIRQIIIISMRWLLSNTHSNLITLAPSKHTLIFKIFVMFWKGGIHYYYSFIIMHLYANSVNLNLRHQAIVSEGLARSL